MVIFIKTFQKKEKELVKFDLSKDSKDETSKTPSDDTSKNPCDEILSINKFPNIDRGKQLLILIKK